MTANPTLPTAVREIMADLERKHPFRESVAEVEHDRWLRQKAAEAEAGRERDTASQQRAWNRAFDQRWDAKWLATLGDEDNDIDAMIVHACSETLALARKETKAALAALKAELRAEMESKLAASERRVEASEARTQKLEAESIELRSQARDSAAKITDDLRRCEADVVKVDKAVTGLRIETGDRLTTLRESMADVVEKRPAVDQGYVDRAVDAIVARALAEARTEHARELEGQQREFAAQIGELKERMETASGRLPVARAWAADTVTYRGSFAVHDGSAWQATKDTAQKPGGSNWLLVAKGGRDGVDGVSMRLRGGFDLRDCYRAMDVVAFEGQGYIATRDNPGVPGVDDGWLLIAARGMKGEKGESGPSGSRGGKGDRGPAGAKIAEWRVARERFCIVPFYTDGTAGPPLRLHDLFQEFLNQTG